MLTSRASVPPFKQRRRRRRRRRRKQQLHSDHRRADPSAAERSPPPRRPGPARGPTPQRRKAPPPRRRDPRALCPRLRRVYLFISGRRRCRSLGLRLAKGASLRRPLAHRSREGDGVAEGSDAHGPQRALVRGAGCAAMEVSFCAETLGNKRGRAARAGMPGCGSGSRAHAQVRARAGERAARRHWAERRGLARPPGVRAARPCVRPEQRR